MASIHAHQRIAACSTSQRNQMQTQMPTCRVSSAQPSSRQQASLLLRSAARCESRITTRPRCVVVRAAAADASASGQKIRIKLKSYWAEMLAEAVEKIRDAAVSTSARISGPVYLPTRRRIYTVLTSPHVNKDAREQFEIRTHSRLVDVKDLTAETIDKLMNLDLPSGVNVEIKL